MIGRSQRILVIDDQPDIRNLVDARLRILQATMLHSGSAADGFEAAHHHRPDLILLDVELTDGNGIDLCRRLKSDAATRDIPVIFLTSLDDPQQKVAGFEVGAVDYVTKPFSGVELVARVRSALRTQTLIQMLETQARTDPLTGLINRKGFLEALSAAVERSQREPSYTFAVVFADLDRFKAINDTLGHEGGDALLVHVARTLSKCIRVGPKSQPPPDPKAEKETNDGNAVRPRHVDVLARLGGDEFVMLLNGVRDVDLAATVAERVRLALSQPVRIGSTDVIVGASLGVRFCQRYGESAERLLRDSDLAMYHAKVGGRGRCVVFDEAMRRFVAERQQVEEDLRQALHQEQLELAFQPIVCTREGGVVGIESQVRWRSPSMGLLQPEHFLPIARESSLISEIDQWMIGEACRQARRWLDLGLVDRGTRGLVRINLSQQTLLSGDVVQQLSAAAASAGIELRHIGIEIAERALVGDSEVLPQVLAEMQRAGIRVILDEFGTGVSSLTAIHQLPLDELKIDHSFVRCLSHSRPFVAIVNALLTLTRNLGMRVIADGIDSTDQVQVLMSLGCDDMQGPFLAPAMSSSELVDWLKKGLTIPLAA